MPSAWYQPTPAHEETRKKLTTPVVLLEQPIPPEPPAYPGPKVCLPGRADEQKSPEVQEQAPKAAAVESSPAVFLHKEKPRRDSVSRYVSVQTCAAAVMLALAFLLRMISESAFISFQTGMQDAVSDLTDVAAVSRMFADVEEQGIEESLRQVLSSGIEEEIFIESAHSVSPSAMGGTQNPTSSKPETTDLPQTAAAAGGRYPVSMEQEPLAISVMAGYATGAVCPVAGTLTSGYGPREHPITGEDDFHTGIDIAASAGTPIIAAASGIVEACGESASLGNYIILRHSEGAVTSYSHCQTLLVKEGDAVDRGEVIALVGSTGVSTGPHLHFECIVNGVITDPSWILEES